MPTPWHYHHHASLMRWYVLDHEQFLSFSILLSSHHSGTSGSLSHLSIGCCSRTVKAFFRCCLANSNLDILFLRLTNGLHLVVNPLYSLWWSLLLIVDFDTHTPTSWRLFLIWPTVVKGFFFTREIILLSSTTVVFHGLPGLLVLLSSPVRSFFLIMFQTVDLATPIVFAISLIGLFWFFSLILACFTDRLFGSHIESWQQQILNANSTLEMNSRPFICSL